MSESNPEAMASESMEESMLTEGEDEAPSEAPQPVSENEWVKKSRGEYALYLADQLGEKALNFLECVSCKLTVNQGMNRCDSGHTLCHVCAQNLSVNKECPVCTKRVVSRTELEHFFSFFPWHHCRNENIGCRQVFLGTKASFIEQHEATCPFNNLRGMPSLTVE